MKKVSKLPGLLGVQGRFVKGGSTEFVLLTAALTPFCEHKSSKIRSQDVLETNNTAPWFTVVDWTKLGWL